MNTKLTCLLLDDELPGLAYLKVLCGSIVDLEVIRAFDNPDLFLVEFEKSKPDFCFLDIEMPGINGLQLKKRLGNTPVVFVTAYSEYAADAFDLNAVDYVRKPVSLERLQQAVDKVRAYVEAVCFKDERIIFNTDRGKQYIMVGRIAVISAGEIDSRDKEILLMDGKTIKVKNISFEKLSSLLPVTQFCRINKSDMVALKAIECINGSLATLALNETDGQTTMRIIGDAYRKELLERTGL